MSNELNIDAIQADTNLDGDQNETLRVYEIGFHFLPTIAEDDIAVQFSHLKSFIEKRGGTFISEEFPKLRDLQYEISKTIKAQKKRYSKAYFGWVKFNLEADQVEGLEKELKAFEPMLRYLFIKTVAENTLSSIPVIYKEGKKGASKDTVADGVEVTDGVAEEAPVVADVIEEAQVEEIVKE